MGQPRYRITAMAPVSGQWSVRINTQGVYAHATVVAWASIAYQTVLPGDQQTETQTVFVYKGRPMTEAEFRDVYGDDSEFHVEPV
ncbi:hypothetical protein [Streptomyces coeruleorubidus]|uniref:Uncharacterized protein n=1 Tax=Streptomyces coeruleorubidus TaxID=116188 RepID=A0A5J6HZS9_STRC4|nr:hypothetical protein [Streptomyces coeruleorubidus]QEV23870.1 hypothetical protein CP976_06750 [Streptomyces coeruleorubidus]GGT86513.1 hypothetical protein GCM10010256_53460 [Streptomyces coeruleorubidus]